MPSSAKWTSLGAWHFQVRLLTMLLSVPSATILLFWIASMLTKIVCVMGKLLFIQLSESRQHFAIQRKSNSGMIHTIFLALLCCICLKSRGGWIFSWQRPSLIHLNNLIENSKICSKHLCFSFVWLAFFLCFGQSARPFPLNIVVHAFSERK